MTTSLGDARNQAFHERLNRIYKGSAHTNGVSMAGPGPVPTAQSSKWRGRLRAALIDVMLSPFALIAGGISVLGARAAALKLFAADGPYAMALDPPVLMMGIELLLALVFMLLLMLIFGFGKGLRRVAVFVGFLGAIIGEQALIDSAPVSLVGYYPTEMVLDAIVDR